jgi:alkanesulfonate monooxygenase SsuD/methylene tetrahydromethanopterin reductase-like flavin-dependent oxidoreductase (luciferase family)
MTAVTCPIMRYHPAIVAQAAATLGLLSNDRFPHTTWRSIASL